MKIKQYGHLAFTCKDIEKSVHFYRDILGLKKKFSITYGDWLNHLQDEAKEKGETVEQSEVERLSSIANQDWIVYMEISDGAFIELFNGEGREIVQGECRFTHIALIVDDIFELEKSLKEKGVQIDSAPSFGLENTWQMWSQDPDGNKIEFMQYTPESWQVVGK